jgi:hypothetical protein
MTEKWNIRIANYGTFEFEGTEEEAEAMRRHKSQWEQAIGWKWRADLSRESDRLMAEMADLADAGRGIPLDMLTKRRHALQAERISSDGVEA